MGEDLQRAFDRIRERIKINERGCWIWQGSLTAHMYGQIKVSGNRNMSTHRVAYLCVNGAIPRGKLIRHTCDVTRCCNPAHLVIGDHEDNVQDMIDRGRAKARRVLTAEEVAEVIALRKAGRTKREICETLHCNWQAVSRVIDSTGVDVKKQGRPKGSKNLRQRFDHKVVRRMQELYANGKYTQQQLAEKFGCDQTYVSLLLKRALQ